MRVDPDDHRYKRDLDAATAAILNDQPERRIKCIEDLPRIEDVAAAEIEWDVEGLIPSGTVVLLTGEPGAGKSTFVSALAYAVSHGYAFLGRETKQRPVLILDAENPSIAVLERFRRLGIETDESFRIWGQWCGEDPPSAGGAIVLEYILRCDPKPLIIIDSFIRFHPGAENDAGDTQKHMAMYRKLAAAGATVIILHHIGKAETAQDYRGSSDIKAAVDIAYKLIDLGDGSKLSRLELKAFKQRMSVTPHLRVQYQAGLFSVEGGEAIKSNTEQLVDLVKQHPGISAEKFTQLAVDKGLGRNRARDFLSSKIASGAIRVQHVGSRHEHHWREPAHEKPWPEGEA